MSNTEWMEDCLEKSEKHITEREQASDLPIQLNQLTIRIDQQMVHADVHDRKEAVGVRKPSGIFNQLQHPLEIQVDKQRDDKYRRTPAAKARPFASLKAYKKKVNYSNGEKQRKSQLESRLRSTILMDLPDNYSLYKKEEDLSANA